MYWESTPDTHNEAVSNAMTTNRFGKIMKYIYCYEPEEAEEVPKLCQNVPKLDHLLKN